MKNGVNLQQTPTEEHPPQLQDLPFSLPPYPQMIMEAIEASNGCNKTAIVKHIESTQIALPPSHLTLLNYHLNQMKESGQIVIAKNNYTKPDPNAPPKRGRGRPPKPKPEGDPSHVAAVPPAPMVSPAPRPTRGRPPKAKAPPSVSGRPRGRPPKKKQKTDSETVRDAAAGEGNNGERRGRGRPRKVEPVNVMVPTGC